MVYHNRSPNPLLISTARSARFDVDFWPQLVQQGLGHFSELQHCLLREHTDQAGQGYEAKGAGLLDRHLGREDPATDNEIEGKPEGCPSEGQQIVTNASPPPPCHTFHSIELISLIILHFNKLTKCGTLQ